MKKLVLLGLILCLCPGCKKKSVAVQPAEGAQDRTHQVPAKRGANVKAQKEAASETEGAIAPSSISTPKDPGAIIAAAVKRRGGLAALQGIRSARATHVVTGAGGGTRRVTLQFPHRLLLEPLSGDKVTGATIVDGHKGYQLAPGKKVKQLDASTLSDIQRSLHCDPVQALINASKAGARLTYKGQTRVEDRPVDEVLVMSGGHAVHLFIAQNDGELLAYRHLTRSGQMTVVHSDFKEVGGTRMAHTNTIRVGGARVVSRVTNLELNPKLPKSTFDPKQYRFPE